MDGAQLSRYPHLSWLRFSVAGTEAGSPLVVHTHGACHTLSLTAQGTHRVRWITRGKELQWAEHVGTAHFVPADDEQHTFLTAMSADFMSRVLLLPRQHVDACLVSEEIEPHGMEQRLLIPDDPLLADCIAQLFAGLHQPHGGSEDRRDEAARRLVLRLHALMGGRAPDWHDDDSTFDRRSLGMLVGHINEHLRIPPALGDMALLVGLSPSHFARKFRQTTGLSLHRFINRQRLGAALSLLKQQSQPLAAIALELGFSSQSHFTRLFSDLTGMTPAKYRKQFRPTIG